jgi:hypothetical protein
MNQDMSQPWSEEAQESLGQLEAFVVDSYGSRNPDVAQLFSPDRELQFSGQFKLGPLQVGAERVPLRDLPAHVQEVNRLVQAHVLQSLNPSHEYFVCFDQLDLGFAAHDVQYMGRLTGLILAARDLRRAARDVGKRLNVVVFLRDDIYRLLQFEDKNKITDTGVAVVEWNARSDGLTLKSLMERRFGQAFNGQGIVSWDDVFDENKEMPSRQTKYAHICDRTFLRPRDMIKFCNETLEAHRRRGDAEQHFVNADLIEARPDYSDYLLNELDDEIAKHVPMYRDYLDVIQSIGREIFDRTTFGDAWSKRPHLAEVDPDGALQQLFEFSVVGYLRTGGYGGGQKWAWRYLDPRPHRATLPAEATTLRIHSGFKEALDLMKGAGPR